MTIKQTFFKIGINTIFQSIGKIVTGTLGFVSVMLLTRYLGPAGYGDFSLVFAYLGIFGGIADFGLQTTIIKHLAKDSDQKKQLFNTFFWLKLFLSFAASIVAIIALIFFKYSPVQQNAILIGALGIFIGNLSGYATTIFQSELKLGLMTAIDVITKVVTVLAIAVFMLLHLNFYFIVSSVVIGNIVGFIFSFYYIRGSLRLSLDFNFSQAKMLIRTSVVIGFTTLLSLTYFKLDTIMLSIMKGPLQVGIYSLAYKIFENMLVFWWFYLASFYPLIASAHGKEDFTKFKKILITSFSIAIFYALSIIIIGYLFAPILIEIFGGSYFNQSIAPFRILLFSSFFFFSTSIFYYYFFIKGKTLVVLSCILLSLLFNFFTNLIFIPKYGYIGASFTTIATEAFLMVIYIAIFLTDYNRKRKRIL